MNKHRFRIIFNQLRGLMMVVAENVKSHTASAESGKTSSSASLSPSCTKDTFANMRPLAFSLMCALGYLIFHNRLSREVIIEVYVFTRMKTIANTWSG
jgi:filamentous hemagglutinin